MSTRKKARPKKALASPVRKRRNYCLICGEVVGSAARAQQIHMLKVHLPDSPAMVEESYEEFFPGVPEMRKSVKKAMNTAREIMELERMYSLPDRRRRVAR
jgi:hypothetical protein